MKYFIDQEIVSREAFRKLAPSLKALYWYAWAKADAAGVYNLDLDYLNTDNKGAKYTEKDFEALQPVGLSKISAGKFLFTDFIEIQYTALKPGYNPHKPAFRALDKNNLILNEQFTQACPKLALSLNEASTKLVGKEEDMDEEEEENNKGGMGGNKTPVKKQDIVIPDEVEFLAYCQEELKERFTALEFSLKTKFKAWKANGWKDGRDKPIKNWKTKIMHTVPYLNESQADSNHKKVTINQELHGKKSGIINV